MCNYVPVYKCVLYYSLHLYTLCNLYMLITNSNIDYKQYVWIIKWLITLYLIVYICNLTDI